MADQFSPIKTNADYNSHIEGGWSKKVFELCTNAYKEGVGALLSQDGKVVAYDTRKLKDHEQRYSMYDLELTMVVHALNVWRYYLLGKRFVLKTNHISLNSYLNKLTWMIVKQGGMHS